MNKRIITAVAFLITFASSTGNNQAFAFQLPPSTTISLPTTLQNPTNTFSTKTNAYRQRQCRDASNLHLMEVGKEQTSLSTSISLDQEQVPTKMSDAVKIFFFSGDCGPLFVATSIFYFWNWRIQLSPIGGQDAFVFIATVLFWSVQEHFLHEKVLHSSQDWIGKQIHQGHHDNPYYHVSIDPASLLLGWMMVAHIFLRLMFPLTIALSATLGYTMAGLFYEWAHYIVHTKVRFKSAFWKRVKENHIKHHMVNHDYWFAFSLPWVDDLFGTNPPVKQVVKNQKQD